VFFVVWVAVIVIALVAHIGIRGGLDSERESREVDWKRRDLGW
jgi:hypothetical protein